MPVMSSRMGNRNRFSRKGRMPVQKENTRYEKNENEF